MNRKRREKVEKRKEDTRRYHTLKETRALFAQRRHA